MVGVGWPMLRCVMLRVLLLVVHRRVVLVVLSLLVRRRMDRRRSLLLLLRRVLRLLLLRLASLLGCEFMARGVLGQLSRRRWHRITPKVLVVQCVVG